MLIEKGNMPALRILKVSNNYLIFREQSYHPDTKHEESFSVVGVGFVKFRWSGKIQTERVQGGCFEQAA
jgi:hypothetical protein